MKSHFQFSNQQRNGIFLLLFIIIVIQCVYMFVDFGNENNYSNNSHIEELRKEIDSLRAAEIENNKPKIYPFNPNYITDYKGYTLGMSNEEIDRLHQFRSNKQWVNSAKDFQKVTQVSDSLLSIISPYFKFPEWVANPKSKTSFTNYNSNVIKSFVQKQDLNKASETSLKKVYGIGEKLAGRIVQYRNRLTGGFHSMVELSEVYGLTPVVIDNVKKEFAVKSPREIKIYNLNTATRDELVLIKYIDYEVANNIIEERTLREGFNSLEELTKVEDFPINKYEIIKLYLHL
ncbi:helix-hairpin-helix domain-containing protein [Winogradskyella sp. KYW1333]|uniref:ComEA family DNA-binding protein n=1 Tax=Winogradskyella sp. KYW1333 TaxID=2282123 RepID=UPI000DF11FE8|nr:helix-hairpin-helix domain-containing protein [Winogradskyella sp. KYW1333]RCT56353.1 helix-hairpin-helix domain-containing protein [Winogradskyella sp. KYW1333]